jgi:hypothetical protein
MEGVFLLTATWIRPLKVNKGKTNAQTITQTITDRTDDAENQDKTNKGELVTGYECGSHTVDAEFLLSKRQYEHITGRNQGSRNALAYHIRQEFQARRDHAAGDERAGPGAGAPLYERQTRFHCATHSDCAHIHNHIVFNSATLDCTRKFNNFKGSTFAVRRLSDRICLEHGLSAIKDPKPSRSHYGT